MRKYRYEWTTECVGGNGSRVTVAAWRVTSATCWFPYSGVVISSRPRISRSRVWQSPNADLLPGGRVQDKPSGDLEIVEMAPDGRPCLLEHHFERVPLVYVIPLSVISTDHPVF